ncbi:MAG: ELWxxDGT repeat protein [Runella sp.]
MRLFYPIISVVWWTILSGFVYLPLKAQTPVLLKDINTTPANYTPAINWGSNPRFLTNANGTLYFTAQENGTTTSLWKSNGSTNGTVKVTELLGTAYGLTNVGNTLYFAADQSGFGFELWKSNGTAAGTSRVKDIQVGTLGSMPESMVAYNNELYFVATNATSGTEIWKSNGTDAGTVVVRDIVPGSGSSFPQALTVINNTLYFVANNGTNGFELWKTNGTAAGTLMVRDILTGSEGSRPQFLTNVNGTLYFIATNGTHGYELWKSDGTANGTVMVKDIRSGTASSMPRFLTAFNNLLYFFADDGQSGAELWRSDGTSAGTFMVADINFGSAGSNPQHLKNVAGKLYFSATNGANGQELWTSDGTTAGTFQLRNIQPDGFGKGSNPMFFHQLKGQAYFLADNHRQGQEFWRTNGSESGTVPLFEINVGRDGGGVGSMVSMGDTLYFAADDGLRGGEVWKLAACLPFQLRSTDTTFCTKEPIALPLLVVNYASFRNHVWRKGGQDSAVVANPNSFILTQPATDFYLTAQMPSGCVSSAKITIRQMEMPESVGSLRVLLEGAYRYGHGTMTNHLNTKGLLPGQRPTSSLGTPTPAHQPYKGFPWFYDGNEPVGSYEPNMTDWVLVSLRTQPDNPATTVFRAAALLNQEGLVNTVKGCPGKLQEYEWYYVAVEHRNHVGIVSAEPTPFVNGHFFYDFTQRQSYIRPGQPSVGQKQVEGRFMMYAGDFQKANSSQEINANDVAIWRQQNGRFAQYLVSDANMDGQVNALDQILWALNNGLFSAVRF